MSSSVRRELDELASGLPVSSEDVLIQRRLRKALPVSTEEYLQFLASLPPAPEPSGSRRKLPRGYRPFELLD